MGKYEKHLMDTYKNVNPSEIEIETDETKLRELKAAYDDLFLMKLKFPKKMFSGCSVLEAGSGTGETSVILADWCESYLGIDPNPYSVNRATELAEHFGSKAKFKPGKFEELKAVAPGQYDIVFSQGVLHHIDDPALGFKNVCEATKDDGFLILLYGDIYGYFQRILQRLTISTMSDGSDESIERAAELYFPEHLERAQRYGKRSLKAIIYDTYVIPRPRKITFHDLIDSARDNGLSLYSSFPQLGVPLRCDSYIRKLEDLDKKVTSVFDMFVALRWMFTQSSDSDHFLNIWTTEKSLEAQADLNTLIDLFDKASVTDDNAELLAEASVASRKLSGSFSAVCGEISGNISSRLSQELNALSELSLKLSQKKVTPEEIENLPLMKGHCGVGLSALIFHKQAPTMDH